MSPTKRELDVLFWAEDRMRHMGWYLTTSRLIPKSVVKRCVTKGWLEELEDPVLMCNDDGSVKDPEQWRTGYRLTYRGDLLLAGYKILTRQREY